MNPQRLVQRSVERSAMVAELSPQLLLLLGVGKSGRIANAPLSRGGAAGAGRRGLGTVPSASSHHVAVPPPHESPLLTPKFGKESDLWVQLDEESVWWKEGFLRCIRQKDLRSAICFRSAREQLS
jgi:hypothetical protein